jgi:hypothetical protein
MSSCAALPNVVLYIVELCCKIELMYIHDLCVG